MSAIPNAMAVQSHRERNELHLGVIIAVTYFDANIGTTPGPASNMAYTVACNDLPGPLEDMRPGELRWDDTWDVHALSVGQPVVLAVVHGVIQLLTREERAEEECNP